MKQIVRDPYAAVDWATWERRKASLHVHTVQSDGALTPAAAIDQYVQRGYDIVSLTDHDSYNPGGAVVQPDSIDPLPHPYPTWPWTDFGRDPVALGVLAIKGNEASWAHHVGTYFTDLWTADDVTSGKYASLYNSVTGIINEIGLRGGLAQMAHPGRYDYPDETYVSLHETYPQLNGHEVYNQGNRYTGDKDRWDRLLQLSRNSDLDLPIWGWSVDDAHIATHFGRNYHIHLMPDFTEASFRTSLESGAFWFVYDPLGSSFIQRHTGDSSFFSAAPVIHSIAATAASITIYATQHTGVRWVSNGVEVETGPRLALSNASLGGYVRAELLGADGAITLTQPWYLADAPHTGWSSVSGGSRVSATVSIRSGSSLVPIGG